MTPAQTAIQEQTGALIAQLTNINAAILALTTGGAASYSLDTGQSVQQVTKLNLSTLRNQAAAITNQLAVLDARCYGTGRSVGAPAW